MVMSFGYHVNATSLYEQLKFSKAGQVKYDSLGLQPVGSVATTVEKEHYITVVPAA